MDSLLREKGNIKSLAKKDFNAGRLEAEYSSKILFDSTDSQGVNIEKNMSRCLAVVQNTGIKWRQDLAKIRGVPDPTIRNDVPVSNKKPKLSEPDKVTATKIEEIKKQVSYKSGLFQPSPITNTVPGARKQDGNKDGEKRKIAEKGKDGPERLDKDSAI